MNAQAPIGLFDSGIGGLTVARRVMEVMPSENIVYFGDSARVPYGSKSSSTVQFYAKQALSFLESHKVKLIIVACNTASAVALQSMQTLTKVPVLGVIVPGAEEALKVSRSLRIGVIGTEGTIRSEAYKMAIQSGREDAIVVGKACPLLVGFAEEGLVTHEATVLITREYLAPLLRQSIDTLIMGCTHYPILEPSIQSVVGSDIALVDPGLATAKEAKHILENLGLINNGSDIPSYRYYLSDVPHKFIEVGERFLGRTLQSVDRVSLDYLSSLMKQNNRH